MVIDNNASSELQRRVEIYANHRALHVTYHRRAAPPGGSTKAAIINFGLTETRIYGRTPAEFCLVLEAEVSCIYSLLQITTDHGI